MSVADLLRRPTGFLPFVLSAAALITIAVHVARAGTEPQADEGTSAHVWMVLMALEVLAIGFFAIVWLPKAARPTILTLALQVAGLLVAMAPVAIFRW